MRTILLLVLLICVPARAAAGQGAGAAAQPRAAQFAEAERLSRQVVELSGAGRYAEAVPLAERASSLYEKALGAAHPSLARALNDLAELYRESGVYERAEPLYRRSLAITEKALGADHRNVAVTLNNLGLLYEARGSYTLAEPLYRRSLAIAEKAHGPDHPSVALTLNNLAELYKNMGAYTRAEPLFRRALAVQEKKLGPTHPAVAVTLNNLGLLYVTMGDPGRAEPLYRRALAVSERALGPDHPNVATALNNLAELYRSKGDYSAAEPLYRRSLAVSEKALGPAHPNVARSLNNLAALYMTEGDHARAEPLLRRSLAIKEKALGPGHPGVAPALGNLAALYAEEGDVARAEALLKRALAIEEVALGPDHPAVAGSLHSLALLSEQKGEHARAVQLLSRASEARERHLTLVLAAGSERQKLASIGALSFDTYDAVSLHARAAPADPQALALALTTIMRRKGRALDAMSTEVANLRRRLGPQDRSLLDQLSGAQTRLSRLALGGPGGTAPKEYRAEIARVEAEVERLQQAVARRSAEFRVRTQPATIREVQRALPAGAALVEFFYYLPRDLKARGRDSRFGPGRYIAYVLRGGGEPLWADLGEAETVDKMAIRLRAKLTCPGLSNGGARCPPAAEVRQAARALDEHVMRPVRRLLGGARHVFLAPDGILNWIPFAALVDEQAKYLIESYSLSYLTTGRDLLRLQISSESRQPPLIIADPLFGPGPMYFGRLPGTAEEAKALGALINGSRVLTRAQATEAAVKQVNGPTVLHVATHGFILPDQPREDRSYDTRGLVIASGGQQEVVGEIAKPLLQSGLAFAGANQRKSEGGEDGILTALEAAGLDLWGTKLVVLSACETGGGEVVSGQGVYGLRRALVLAGSESQVMSLWKVSDEATRDLMVAYYKRLVAGEGRTEALRQVQLEMLRGRRQGGGDQARGLSGLLGGKGADRGHPYYWAAFIQSGDWDAMNRSAQGH